MTLLYLSLTFFISAAISGFIHFAIQGREFKYQEKQIEEINSTIGRPK